MNEASRSMRRQTDFVAVRFIDIVSPIWQAVDLMDNASRCPQSHSLIICIGEGFALLK